VRRRLFLAAACLGLLCVYGFALMWVEGYYAALPIPSHWMALFPSRRSGVLWFGVLFNPLVLILVSLPVALLVARFGGRRATVVALSMTTALFVATVLPSLVENIGRGAYAGSSALWRSYIALWYLELIVALPLLVLFLRKLPSSNRWRGP
jgi:LytS/YehU family sensor histidine kinase